jgi:hypothetical protein
MVVEQALVAIVPRILPSGVSFEPVGGEPSQIINEPLTFYIWTSGIRWCSKVHEILCFISLSPSISMFRVPMGLISTCSSYVRIFFCLNLLSCRGLDEKTYDR